MNPWKYHIVTCADLTHLNPINPAGFDELVDLLDVPAGGRVLDIACGKAECLIRIASRYTITGVGVDLCPEFLAAARTAARQSVPSTSTLSFVEQDGASYAAPDGSFDLTVCLGASWVFGGYQGTVRRLASLVRPGGQIMVGEPFWIREPDLDYLNATDMHREAFRTHAGNAAVGEQEGLSLLYTLVSSPADWDRYEGRRWRAAERYAAVNPDDPDLASILDRCRRWRDAYLRWGRDCLGWAVYLFQKA
ncbi:MAG TPA: class I SAM-dependent methyltransferase [Symbiobacteriaceae bacterium]|nr:class I SAM-dependent methyltransferase [Symbiobacteriaceae bacterium]